MKKSPKRTEMTKKNIAQSFCILYSKMPLNKISVKSVIEYAGYNRSTFYEYFEDIYDLLSYVEDDVISYLKDNINNEEMHISVLVGLFNDKKIYLNALMGEYGNNHFNKRLIYEFSSYIYEKNSNISEKFQPYFNEIYITSTLSAIKLWMNNQDIPSEELFNLISDFQSNLQALFIKKSAENE